MVLEVYKDEAELGRKEAEHIAELINSKEKPLLCLPAGQSFVSVYNALIEMYKKGDVSFEKVKIVGLDEWCDYGNYESSARWILDTSFFNYINLKKENMRMFNPHPEDTQKECHDIEQYIEDNGGIDYLGLGVGMNGHVGLNEPGADFTLGAHVNDLAQKTLEVSDKYFKDGIPPLKRGLTLGFKNFFAAREIVIAFCGAHKAPIVKKFMETPITSDFPVTNMKKSDKTRVIMDRAAASDIYVM